MGDVPKVKTSIMMKKTQIAYIFYNRVLIPFSPKGASPKCII